MNDMHARTISSTVDESEIGGYYYALTLGHDSSTAPRARVRQSTSHMTYL